jgi:hypothetical protein
MAAALALTVLGVAAQDSGHGVTNVTLPDGRSVPVFTDGRLNAFDIGAPVVVFYTAANGNIVNPDIAPGTQPDLSNLNFSNSKSLSEINNAMGTGNNSANANAVTNNGVTVATQPDPAGLISHLQVLAVGADSGTTLVLNPSVEDLLSLVTGQQKSLSSQGYTVNFDAIHNYFWVQAPADFEGKVYSFAWPNNIFPTSLIGERIQGLTTSSNANANANSQANTQAQPTAQPSNSNQSGAQATAQPTQAPAQPTMQPTAST